MTNTNVKIDCKETLNSLYKSGFFTGQKGYLKHVSELAGQGAHGFYRIVEQSLTSSKKGKDLSLLLLNASCEGKWGEGSYAHTTSPKASIIYGIDNKSGKIVSNFWSLYKSCTACNQFPCELEDIEILKEEKEKIKLRVIPNKSWILDSEEKDIKRYNRGGILNQNYRSAETKQKAIDKQVKENVKDILKNTDWTLTLKKGEIGKPCKK